MDPRRIRLQNGLAMNSSFAAPTPVGAEPRTERRRQLGVDPQLHAAISVCETRLDANTRHARMSSGSR
jgi:hypothetical protein